MLFRTAFSTLAGLTLAAAALFFVPNSAHAQTSPEAFVREISNGVIEAVKSDASPQQSDVTRLIAQVEATVMPAIDFQTVTRSAVGPHWREATTEQRRRLQDEFKTLLISFYSGGIRQISDYEVNVAESVPVPNRPTQVIVRSLVSGRRETHQLDYRLDKTGEGWKIVDLSLDGIWVTLSYRSQFAEHLAKGGVDGLIAALTEQNRKGRKP